MDRVHYNVNGLVNSTSKTHIKNALDKIEGVEKVCVDVARGSVEVVFNEETKVNEIKKCIEDTGYNIEN